MAKLAILLADHASLSQLSAETGIPFSDYVDLPVWADELALAVRAELTGLAERWLAQADELDDVDDQWIDGDTLAKVVTLRGHAHELLDLAGVLDRESSASRQHYIDTGRYLRTDTDSQEG